MIEAFPEYGKLTAPDPRKQKAGWAKLDAVFAESANTWAIHYSCESFYDRPDGASPRITSIAVRRLDSGQTESYSIHQVAEERGIPFDEIEAHYDNLEKRMLDAFFAHIGRHMGVKFLHWNMRDINYGFAALEHRHRVLRGRPVVIDDDRKIDLARLFIDIFGTGYARHPRLESLLDQNNIKARDFLTGAHEAEAFEQRNYVALHQSTLRKVDVIANLAERAHHRQLRTLTRWWGMHGGRARLVADWLARNPWIAFLASLASIAGLVLAFATLRH